MEPAALLTRAGDTSLNAAHAPSAVNDHEPGLVQPAALEITEHGSPALARLAIAVLDREQLLDPVLSRADDDQ